MIEKLKALGQEGVLRFWERLDEKQRERLRVQVDALDERVFRQQQALVKQGEQKRGGTIEPFLEFTPFENEAHRIAGEALIREGKVGCLIVAGGQATRLKLQGPKGMFPVSVVRHKSLFQLFCEKTWAAGKRAGRALPLALMTSPQNHAMTVQFFKENKFFGLKEEQVFFFSQRELPLLNENGNLFLDQIDHIAEGPDGNGSTLSNFIEAGIWRKWSDQGIQILNFVLIDNPLADPFDPYLIGAHAHSGSEITLKCIARQDPLEKVGVIVKQGGQPAVIEYTEMPAEERIALGKEGKLKHLLANISLFCFSMEAIPGWKSALPLHLAHKAVNFLDKQGHLVNPTQPMAWKFEKFIFDLLPLAKKVHALVYPREICFAPLKNLRGSDDLASVQKALQARDRQILTTITSFPLAEPFELSQEFHYPTPDLLARWKQRDPQGQTYLES